MISPASQNPLSSPYIRMSSLLPLRSALRGHVSGLSDRESFATALRGRGVGSTAEYKDDRHQPEMLVALARALAQRSRPRICARAGAPFVWTDLSLAVEVLAGCGANRPRACAFSTAWARPGRCSRGFECSELDVRRRGLTDSAAVRTSYGFFFWAAMRAPLATALDTLKATETSLKAGEEMNTSLMKRCCCCASTTGKMRAVFPRI